MDRGSWTLPDIAPSMTENTVDRVVGGVLGLLVRLRRAWRRVGRLMDSSEAKSTKAGSDLGRGGERAAGTTMVLVAAWMFHHFYKVINSITTIKALSRRGFPDSYGCARGKVESMAGLATIPTVCSLYFIALQMEQLSMDDITRVGAQIKIFGELFKWSFYIVCKFGLKRAIIPANSGNLTD